MAGAMSERARGLARRASRALASAPSPLGAVLAIAVLFRLTGLVWGLPASDGWDDDGVAPRDFLVGVVMTYWPGHHNIYPPLHLIGLTLVSAPVWIAACIAAPSRAPEALVHAFIQVPTMTALAVIARAASAAMSLGLLWAIAAIGEDLGVSRRAGVWTAAACGAVRHAVWSPPLQSSTPGSNLHLRGSEMIPSASPSDASQASKAAFAISGKRAAGRALPASLYNAV